MKVIWHETSHGNKWRGFVGHGLSISIVKESSGVGWMVAFLDQAVEQRFATLVTAQMAGVQLAKEVLKDCQETLNDPGN